MDKKLYRSAYDKKIAGVCGGIAEYFNIDSTIVRLILVAFCLMGGAGVLLYIIAWIIMPERPENNANYSNCDPYNNGNPYNNNPYDNNNYNNGDNQ